MDAGISFWDHIFSYLGYSIAILMDVGWHSLASPVRYWTCRLLREMPIWVLLMFQRLWVCYHCWLERVGCTLGTNSVIRYDLVDIFLPLYKGAYWAGFFFLIVTGTVFFCVCMFVHDSTEDSLWGSVFPPCRSEGLNCPSGLATSARTHWAIFSAQVLSCGVVNVCLFLLSALLVSYLRNHCQIQYHKVCTVPLLFLLFCFKNTRQVPHHPVTSLDLKSASS